MPRDPASTADALEAPPTYFDDAQRAAWDEIVAGTVELRGTGDRLRAECAAVLLAELRTGPAAAFTASKHAQLRALLAELLPPVERPTPAAPDDDEDLNAVMAEVARGLERMTAKPRRSRSR